MVIASKIMAAVAMLMLLVGFAVLAEPRAPSVGVRSMDLDNSRRAEMKYRCGGWLLIAATGLAGLAVLVYEAGGGG